MATKKGGRKTGKKAGLTIDNQTHLHFELDAAKVAAIKRCLEKGKLSISLSRVNLVAAGRAGGGYEYD